MMRSNSLPRSVQFGNYELDTRTGELCTDDHKVQLQEQPLQILIMLIERAGDVVTREELHKALWPGSSFGDLEDSLNHGVRRLREALGDAAEKPRFIETVPRRGYRFIPPVNVGAGLAMPHSKAATRAPQKVRRRMRSKIVAATATVVLALGLSVAWFITHRPTPPVPQLTERRLTSNPSENTVNQGAISPDGRYLAYSDQKGMHLKLIRTGEVLDIPQPQGPNPPAPGNWWPNAWFPDGTRFVASIGGVGVPMSAWIVPVMGEAPRKLRDNADAWSVSPDGTQIAFGTGYAFTRQREIWLIGAQGEAPRRFVSGSEDDAFFWAAWSPDGRRIAYQKYHRAPDKLECSIESRDLNGSAPTLILRDPRLCEGSVHLSWLPDGRLIYTMLGPGKLERYTNLWEIQTDTERGQPLSQPRQITNWVEALAMSPSVTSDGKQLAITKISSQGHIFVGELEGGGRRLREPRRLTLEQSSNLPSAWTPDSKAVLFQSNRNGTWDIFKQALHQDVPEPVAAGPDYKSWPVVSPDGSWILYLSRASPVFNPTDPTSHGFSASTPVRIMRVPASGGAPELVLEGQGIDQLACARPPATLCVFSQETQDRKQLAFTRFYPAQAKSGELTTVNLKEPVGDFGWDLSPDGSRLAFTQFDLHEGNIRILPLTGGQDREVKVAGRSGFSRLCWASDGQAFFVTAGGPSPGGVLLHVDLQGRAQVVWQDKGLTGWNYGPNRGVPSPDGRYLAILGYTNDSNVWLLENF